MANNFSLNPNVVTAWAAQLKAQKGVMLEPQVRKSGKGFNVVHRMPLASLLHGLLWKISKGYRNNRIEERHAYLNVLEDQVRTSYGLVKKYSSNGHRLANPEVVQGRKPADSVDGSPVLPTKCYEKLRDDTGPSQVLFNRINAARENASVNRKAYMTSLHEIFLGIASKTPYSQETNISSLKKELRKPARDTNCNRLAEACRRETVAYEGKREKATGSSYVSEAMQILPPVDPPPLPPTAHNIQPAPSGIEPGRRQAPEPPTQTEGSDPIYEQINPTALKEEITVTTDQVLQSSLGDSQTDPNQEITSTTQDLRSNLETSQSDSEPELQLEDPPAHQDSQTQPEAEISVSSVKNPNVSSL